MNRRVLGALALLAAVHAAVTFARSSLEPEPTPARIMPAPGGAIEEMAIQFHRSGGDRFLEVYRDMFAALRRETTVLVVVGDAEDERLFEEARGAWGPGPRVRYVHAGRPITSWARDRMAVLDAPDGTVILAPPRPQDGVEARVHDWLVPWALGDALGPEVRVQTAPFVFDGGDLIADEERVYVATPLFARNPRTDPVTLVARLRETLGRDVVRIGGDDLPVPDHHIGMFLTPLGGARVAYGDPDLALRALGLHEGDHAVLEVGGEPLELDLSSERLQPFRNVRAALEASGLTPVPMPIVPAAQHYVFLSYDNVILERRSDGMHVLLPHYGVPALDDAAREAWERLGAHVHPVHAAGIVRLGGSIRCLVAPIARSAA